MIQCDWKFIEHGIWHTVIVRKLPIAHGEVSVMHIFLVRMDECSRTDQNYD